MTDTTDLTDTSTGPRSSPVVRVDGLTAFYGSAAAAHVLDSIDLVIDDGDHVGIVGESGSGKSTLALALGGLLPRSCRIEHGTVHVAGTMVHGGDGEEPTKPVLRALRRDDLAFIPQDPSAALDPTMRIGRQFSLAMRARGTPISEQGIEDALEAVRIERPAEVCGLLPHEISGGMAQRVAVAMAVARRPRLLVADEPTAALDAEVRAEVLELIVRLADTHGITLLWVSHDIPAVRRWCRRAVVMRAGRIVEDGPAEDVLVRPRHPYTQELVGALADVREEGEGRR